MPPPTACKAAQRRVSSGSSGSGERSGWGGRAARIRALLGRVEFDAVGADQVDGAFEAVAVDHDPDQVAVADPADRPPRQRLGTDVADARTGRDAREPGVGQDGDLLAEREVLQGRGDLVDLLHARPHRAAADQDQDVAGLDRPVPCPLMAAIASRSRVKTRAGPSLR